MARGNSSRAASEQGDNPFKAGSLPIGGLTPEREARDFVEGFLGNKDFPNLGKMDEGDYDNTVEEVLQSSSEVRDQRDEFDSSVKAGAEALKNAKFDWQDKRAVGDLVALTFSEVQDGYEGYDVLMAEYEDSMQTDPAYDDARSEDREYEEAEGEPASLRGNSREDALFADWAKGFIKDRIESASSNRNDYDDEISLVQEVALSESVDNWTEKKDTEATRRADDAERRSRQKFDPEDLR